MKPGRPLHDPMSEFEATFMRVLRAWEKKLKRESGFRAGRYNEVEPDKAGMNNTPPSYSALARSTHSCLVYPPDKDIVSPDLDRTGPPHK